jgi:RimJ/RimL family protein N-acetyltransferase
MKVMETSLAIRSLPLDFQTKTGETLRLKLLGEQRHQRLVEMYLAYQPRGSFQELPPPKDSVCVAWVREMIRTGINMVADSSENKVVGHVALFPINDQRCEVLVVVSPAYQDMGIGTELIQSGLQIASELGFERICLPVDAGNARARHVYRKCGFQYASDPQEHQIDMVCDLTQMRTAPVTTAEVGLA